MMYSLLSISVVAAVAGISSYALWSDVEVSATNVIEADEMDLQMGGSFPISIYNVEPNEKGSVGNFTLANDSAEVDGELQLAVINKVNYENGCSEPESEATEGNDTSCSGTETTVPSGANDGELEANMTFGLWVDLDNDGALDAGEGVGWVDVDGDGVEDVGEGISVSLTQLVTDFNALSMTLLPGDTDEDEVIDTNMTLPVEMFYIVADNAPFADNIFMTDSIEFDLEFTLTQIIP